MDEPLRILQVIETGGPGGAETVFAQLASGLRERGHAVHCLTRAGSWLPAELERRGLPSSRWSSSGAFDLSMLQRLRSLMRRERIEVVHAHLFDGAVYATMAARSLGIPSVVTLHGQVDVRHGGWKADVKGWLLRRCATRVVMVSDALRRELAEPLGLESPQVTVVHNGVEDRLHDLSESHASSPSPPHHGSRIIAIGNIRPAKDYPTLIAAFAQLHARDPRVHLDVVGEPDRGSLFSQIQSQVDSLGLRDAVTFHGFLPDPATLLGRADVFVLASSREGFSLATIEAMLASVPVVCTRSGGPEEIVSDGATGMLVPVGDPEALCVAVERVLRDKPLYSAIAARARASALERFSITAMLDRYESLYESIARPRRY